MLWDISTDIILPILRRFWCHIYDIMEFTHL